MGIVTATAGLWAAKGLWQFVPVYAGYYQFETVCNSLWQAARHKLFVTVTLPTLDLRVDNSRCEINNNDNNNAALVYPARLYPIRSARRTMQADRSV